MIQSSELILNPDGSVYHLNLKPEHIAHDIIFVGDQNRVEKITQFFDSIELSTQKREFKTQTGYFKGKNPNVSLETLEANWVENSLVLYIGKTGGENSDRTLTMRIEELIAFGTGNNVAHYGGRLIWQLKNSKDLVVCWKPMLKADPETVKKELLKEFVAKYGKRPFANLKD